MIPPADTPVRIPGAKPGISRAEMAQEADLIGRARAAAAQNDRKIWNGQWSLVELLATHGRDDRPDWDCSTPGERTQYPFLARQESMGPPVLLPFPLSRPVPASPCPRVPRPAVPLSRVPVPRPLVPLSRPLLLRQPCDTR